VAVGLSTLATLAALGSLAWWLATRPVSLPEAPPAAAGTTAPLAAGDEPAPVLEVEAPVDFPALPQVAAGGSASPSGAGGIDTADVSWANALARRLQLRQPVSVEDLRRVEELRRRHPARTELDPLLIGTLLSLARGEQQARRYSGAERLLLRATIADPAHRAPWTQLLGVRFQAGDWRGTEEAAHRLLAVQPEDPDTLYALGFALFRQDRTREALDALKRAARARDDPNTRALIARIEKGRSDEAGFRQQQLAHFNVRYDGSEHQAVGRVVLRALERHYATLVRTLDHKPETTIPVILFTRAGYYDASGAPAWSGGVYDQLDGRIRIPVGGLTESLTPDMDGTLIHEVTHAFVHSMSRGTAPRVIHEGLAQYMEGQRVDRLLSREQLKLLAQGRASGVSGFYIESLGYVEFLLSRRSMGGMQDLFEAMAATGRPDQAFQQVYGRSAGQLEQDWRDWMKRRYGR
jgi:tetratricopeptide (TPR) repeat protein